MSDQNSQIDVVLQTAEAKLAQGHDREAAAICEASLQNHPGHIGLMRLLGLARAMQDDNDAALVLLKPIEAQFSSDIQVQLALGDAEFGRGMPEEAVPHYRKVVAARPFKHDYRIRLGFALLAARLFDEARVEMEKILAVSPDHADALTKLGLALDGLNRKTEAEEILRRALALERTNHAPAYHLATLLQESGDIEEAIALFQEATKRSPRLAHLYMALGDAIVLAGRKPDAVEHYRKATEVDPNFMLGWRMLGDLAYAKGELAEAAGYYRRAMKTVSDYATSPFRVLANTLHELGEKDEAISLKWQWMEKSFWALNQPKPRISPDRPRVATLSGFGFANTPTDYVIDTSYFDNESICVLDGFPFDFNNLGRCFDVFFNALSDPDTSPDAFALAEKFAAQLPVPMINPPSMMADTMRHLTPQKLGHIPGLYVPRTDRFDRTFLRDHYASALSDFPFPILLRPAGSHGGKGLEKIDDLAGLPAAIDAMDCDFVYVTEFVDFAGADGCYRKLRMMFVDHEAYPVHLSISEDWLNHYYRTRTADEEAWRREEITYLQDPEIYLGPELYEAMRQVGRVHPLEYYGLDGAIDKQGRLVVFECNATMLVRHRDRRASHEHKRAAAEAVQSAVRALLIKTARR